MPLGRSGRRPALCGPDLTGSGSRRPQCLASRSGLLYTLRVPAALDPEVLPAFHCTRGQLKSVLGGFTILAIASGKKVRTALPEGARVGSIAWSTRGDRMACALYAIGGAELWVVDASTGSARKLDAVRL